MIDLGVRIPDGLVVGEDPELYVQAFPPHRERRHADHAAHARQAWPLTAPARSVERLGKLPAKMYAHAAMGAGGLESPVYVERHG